MARENLAGADEVHWRGAAGRAYYALMLECREALSRWGFPLRSRDNVHAFVRLRFTFAADPDLQTIGKLLETGVKLRNRADYQLSRLTDFASKVAAEKLANDVQAAIDLLDAIDSDPVRKAAAIAAIRAAFP